MAEVIWTEPALADLEAIADYIAVENPAAAREFIRRVFSHMDKPQQHPRLGRTPPELEGARYREIVEPPCRMFYRREGNRLFIVHVMRAERLLREENLKR